MEEHKTDNQTDNKKYAINLLAKHDMLHLYDNNAIITRSTHKRPVSNNKFDVFKTPAATNKFDVFNTN